MPVVRQSFKAVSHIGEDGLSNQLETNLKIFLDYALLKVGGWTDITIPQGGAYGGDFSTLRFVDDPFYTDGRVWEAARKDWVWETGINYIDATGGGPYNPTGVGNLTINGGSAANTYVTSYPLGRIIFDSAISITSVVQLRHSFRDVQVYRADDAPWWRELQFQSWRPDRDDFDQSGSGNWSILGNQRVQMPAIVVEAVPRGDSLPYELGNGSLIRRQDIMFHVLSENRGMRNNLVDILANQSDDHIWLFDTNEIAASSAFPLTVSGDRVSNPLMYPKFVDARSNDGYRWKKCRFTNATITEMEGLHLNLYQGSVRMTTEVIIGPLT